MTGIRNKFASLCFSEKYPPIHPNDGSSSHMVGDRVRTTTILTVNDVLFVPNFDVSLLFISQITNITIIS